MLGCREGDNVATSQGMLRIPDSHQKMKDRLGTDRPTKPPDLWQKTLTWCCKPPRPQYFVRVAKQEWTLRQHEDRFCVIWFSKQALPLDFQQAHRFVLFIYKPSFPGNSDGEKKKKKSTYNAGDLNLISGLGRSSGGGHGNPLQYSYLKNLYVQRSLVGYSP